MKFSIITPSYNSAKYILDMVQSVQNQTNDVEIEHIIMDGKSTDTTVALLAQHYPQAKVRSEKDNGQSDAINKGFSFATGDIYAWQNADDLYTEDAFARVSRFFSLNPQIDLVYSNYHSIDENGNQIWDGTPPDFSAFLFKNGRFSPVQPTVFFRKKVWDTCGPLDTSLNFCMDVDFYAKALCNGFKIAKMDGFLGTFRVHQESKTSNKENREAHEQEYYRVLAKNFNYSVLNTLFFNYFRYRGRVGRFVNLTIKPRLFS